MDTKDLNGVHIFKAGKWNGDTYTENDLDDIVLSFNEIGSKIKPYVKLGHNPEQGLLKKDGFPSAGWITNVYKKGLDLFVDIKNMPGKVADLLDKKAYGRVSSEIYWGLTDGEKKYNRVLKGIALLGADTPALTSLDDFIDLYTESDYEKLVLCSQEEKMDKEINVKEYTDEIDALKKENEELKKYSEQVEYDKKSAEVETYLDKAVESGKITPVQKDFCMAISLDSNLKTYTNSESKSFSGNGFEMIKGIVDNSAKTELGAEETLKTDVSEKAYSKEVDENEGDKLDEKIKAYAKENKVSYVDAYDAVTMEVL